MKVFCHRVHSIEGNLQFKVLKCRRLISFLKISHKFMSVFGVSVPLLIINSLVLCRAIFQRRLRELKCPSQPHRIVSAYIQEFDCCVLFGTCRNEIIYCESTKDNSDIHSGTTYSLAIRFRFTLH